MALVDIGGVMSFPVIPDYTTDNSTSFANSLLDAAAEYAGIVVQVPRDGTIDRMAAHFGAITTGGNVEFRVDTVSTSDGGASGTLYNVSDSLVVHAAVTGDANTTVEKTFATPFTVSRGDLIAIIVKSEAASAFDGNITEGRRQHSIGIRPYHVHFTGSLTKDDQCGMLSLRYDNGAWTFFYGSGGIHTSAGNEAFDDADNPDERGMLVVPKVGMRCVGMWWAGRQRIATTTTFRLYDTDGSTILESQAVDLDTNQVGGYGLRRVFWANAETLTKSGNYRVTIHPDDASNTQNLFVRTYADNAYIEASGFPINSHYTAQNNDGGFAETNTKHPMIGILFDQIDEPAGGGGASGVRNPLGGPVG